MANGGAAAVAPQPPPAARTPKSKGTAAGTQRYGMMMSVFAKSGDVAGAVQTVEYMMQHGILVHRTTINCILEACAKSGNVEVAERWVKMMASFGQQPNRATYCSMIIACVKAGDLTKAENWILQLHKSGFTLPSGFCHSILVAMMESSPENAVIQGTLDRAASWLQHINTIGIQVDTSKIKALRSKYARADHASRAALGSGRRSSGAGAALVGGGDGAAVPKVKAEGASRGPTWSLAVGAERPQQLYVGGGAPPLPQQPLPAAGNFQAEAAAAAVAVGAPAEGACTTYAAITSMPWVCEPWSNASKLGVSGASYSHFPVKSMYFEQDSVPMKVELACTPPGLPQPPMPVPTQSLQLRDLLWNF